LRCSGLTLNENRRSGFKTTARGATCRGLNTANRNGSAAFRSCEPGAVIMRDSLRAVCESMTDPRSKEQPLAIDLFCGLGGWTEGLLAEGYRVIGFDNERHVYGEARYPGQLVIQDVLTLHGSQFKDAALIVASPPCQAYSYRAMPWKRAKALPPPDNSLFEACFRIQREANAAADHFIPLVVENVKGAQKWVGRAPWHFGSFYLWGDVPALMPIVQKRMGAKNDGGTWFAIGSPGQKEIKRNPVHEAVKGANGGWFNDDKRAGRSDRTGRLSQAGSKSSARKAASAHIAKIPLALARHIAAAWKPENTHV